MNEDWTGAPALANSVGESREHKVNKPSVSWELGSPVKRQLEEARGGFMLSGSPSSRSSRGLEGGTAFKFLALVNRVRDSGPCTSQCGYPREEMRGSGAGG